jgi:hypothetical protein
MGHFRLLNSTSLLTLKNFTMKSAVQLVKFICVVMFCIASMVSCEKDPDVPDPNDPGDSTNVDTISNHLQFFEDTKIPGAIPTGPAVSSLFISVEDTIYLVDQVKRSIKFLHVGATPNVAGVYLQVHSGSGNFASYYYNVPEEPEVAPSDSVSVIMVGFDPAGFDLPLIFNVTITPYDANGQPIATDIRPVKVISIADVSNTGPCTLVNPPGEQWLWDMSYTENPNGGFSFYNDPKKIWGSVGQIINGSCCNGISVYGKCPGDTVTNASLLFNTIFMYPEESFKFLENGTFARTTIQVSNNPFPSESDFCGPGPGVVRESRNVVNYAGNWTFDATTKNLQLQTTSSTGFGWGNPGGIIHQLDCSSLVMIQLDREGGGNHLYKFYSRLSATGVIWYPFP